MRVTIKTQNRSITRFGKRYDRGEVYDVDDETGAKLVDSGDFAESLLPPPDPLDANRDRVAAFMDQLAAMGDDAVTEFGQMVEMFRASRRAKASGDAAAAAIARESGTAAPKLKPDEQVVTNDEPRSQGAEPAAADEELAEDLETMTVPQLRALARERRVPIPAGSNKDAIVKLLRKAA